MFVQISPMLADAVGCMLPPCTVIADALCLRCLSCAQSESICSLKFAARVRTVSMLRTVVSCSSPVSWCQVELGKASKVERKVTADKNWKSVRAFLTL